MEKIRVALEHPSEAESLMLPDHLFGAKSLSAEALEAYLGQIKQANSMSRFVCVFACVYDKLQQFVKKLYIQA